MDRKSFFIAITVIICVFVAGFYMGRQTRPEYELIKFESSVAVFNKNTGEMYLYKGDEKKFLFIDIIKGNNGKIYKAK